MQVFTETLLQEAVGRVRVVTQLLSGSLPGDSDTDLLALTAEVGELARAVDTLAARIAGEVAIRSEREAIDPLAKRMGEKTAALLIAREADVPVGRAAVWCRVGAAVTAPRTLAGQPLPVAFEAVADALGEGRIDVDRARVILDTLDEVAPLTTIEKLAGLEERLLEHAAVYTRQELIRFCRRVPEVFDPDGAEPREDEIRARAGVKELRERNGLLRWLVEADPERGGLIRAGFDAVLAPGRQVRFRTDGDTTDDDPLFDDDLADARTPAQRRLDALVAMAVTSLRADTGEVSGIAATVLVTMDLDALTTGVGTATVAGVDTP
ncbi:MAG TPA: DUF222 domain-containing protein, partial [Naasia sp.]